MKKNFILLLIFIFITSASALAQTWTGTTSTDWNTATNWNPAGVPTAGGNVVIPGSVASSNWPVFAGNVIINSIDMQPGCRLDVNGFRLTINGVNMNNNFNGAIINNSNGATDIVFNINTGTGGFVTYFRSNTINDNIEFNITGNNQFIEAVADPANVYNGNATFNINDVLNVAISYTSPSQFNGHLTVNRTVAGVTSLFNAGASITGNFTYATNTASTTGMGNIAYKTSIGGTVNITANYPSPAGFGMVRLVNQTTGGTIDIQNSEGFNVQNDTLKVAALSITGYRGNLYSNLMNNSITGNVTIADDAGYGGGYLTYVRNNIITGNSSFSNNGSNTFAEADVIGTGNIYNGSVSFTGGGVGTLLIGYGAPLQCTGNLTINRTATGITSAFNSGAVIGGNFTYTNNAGGATGIGNINFKTSIGGTVSITANYTTSNNIFGMARIINQTTGGSINVQNSTGFDLLNDTLKLTSLSFTGYRGGANGRLWNNDITGNVTIADDISYGGGYNTTIRDNVITGNSTFSNNGSNILFDADAAATGNIYNGNVTFNAAGGQVNISFLDALQCSGNLTVNRTVAGITSMFNAGGTVAGNFSYTNNAGGATGIGNINFKTSIGGTVSITANYTTSNNIFGMARIINQTTGGSINVQNSTGFDLLNDTLKLTSLSFTGYRGGAYGRLWNNDITGNVTIADDVSYGGGYNTTIRNNIITGNSNFSNNGSNILFDADAAATGNKYIGNVAYIKNGGIITVAAGDFNEISQNLTLNAADGISLGKIKFNGNTNGLIEQMGTQSVSIAQLMMEKTGSATVTLNDSVSISTMATFTGGNIISSLANPLLFLDNTTATGASDASFVSGPVIKVGNDAFIFPVGTDSVYAPISITAPSLVTDVFWAQYFNTPPHIAGYDTTLHDLSLHHLSRREYFILDRTNGAAAPKVTLSWKTIRSGAVNVPADLRVARWNGTTWKDEGNGGTTGSNAEGTIQSLNNIISFSPFTLASTTINNPLPVNFILFDVTLRNGNTVLVKWKTSDEINNARFEVERSTDGRNWMKLSTVQPQATHEYEYIDYGVAGGIYYYRVKQVDRDGNFKYTQLKVIRVSADNKIFIWPNPAANTLFVQTPHANGSMEISDAGGKILWKEVITSTVTAVRVHWFAKGLYILTIRLKDKVVTKKFIKE